MNSRRSSSSAGVLTGARLWLMAFAVIALIFGSAAAQTEGSGGPQPQSNSSSKAIDFRGEYGAFGELYGISGAPARRPGSTGRLFLRSTLTAWGSVSASLNLMLSNEGSSARQDINQLDFNPRWRWGQAHIGDFCEELSPLTMSGVKVRGGGLLLSPGPWRFSLLSGMTSRAVASEGSGRSYERSITGLKLGYGRADGTAFDLNIVSSRDRLNSIADVTPDTTTADTTVIDFEQNPVTVTPQENFVVSAATNFVFLAKRLRWRSEVGAAAITRDRRSSELDNSGVPEFLTNLFTPRKSSGADFAYTTDLNLDVRPLAFTAGFHYYGPGYVSLGLASLLSDRQEISAGATYRFRGGMARIDGALQHDNLIHQKSYTTDRTRINTVLSYRVLPAWNATAGITYVGMENDAASDTVRLDYGNWVLRTSHQVTLGRQNGFRSVSMDLIYQHAADGNPFRQATGFDSWSSTVRTMYGLTPEFDFSPFAGFISSRSGAGGNNLTQNYGLLAHHVTLQRRLNSTAGITVSVASVNTTVRPTLRSGYDFPNGISAVIELEVTAVKGGAEVSRFTETAGRLIVSRRF